MLRDQDIICLSSIDWDDAWQGPQAIMHTLSQRGNRVLFIENTGVRAPTLRDLPRIRQRLVNWRRGFRGIRKERESLYVYSPLVFPFPRSRLFRLINRWLFVPIVKRWLRSAGFNHPIVWVFLPTQLSLDFVEQISHKLLIYYCVDRFANVPQAAGHIKRTQHQILKRADLVFSAGEILKGDLLPDRPDVHTFYFGVSHSNEWIAGNGEPSNESPFPFPVGHPVIGYIGSVNRWIDQELIRQLAHRYANASLIFVGPVRTDVSALRQEPNIHFVGHKPYQELPRYIHYFHVGLIPYQVTDYTYISRPTKMLDYLALGKPVVSTPLPEMELFNRRHQGAVFIAKDMDDFVRKVGEAVEGDTADQAARRREVTRHHQWRLRIEEMSELIEHALERKKTDQATHWQENLRRLYAASRHHLIRWTLALAGLYLLVFQTPMMWLVAAPLYVEQPPQRCDAIVVFAGGVGESGQAGEGYQERVKQAVELYRQGLAPRIIFSSGYTYVFPEAEVMQALAMAQGVPASMMLLETKATNTFENVTHVGQMLRAHGWDRILLVSSPYHMRRAILTWRRMAPKIAVIPSLVPHSQFYAHTYGIAPRQIHGILHEYLGILYYWWRGWI